MEAFTNIAEADNRFQNVIWHGIVSVVPLAIVVVVSLWQSGKCVRRRRIIIGPATLTSLVGRLGQRVGPRVIVSFAERLGTWELMDVRKYTKCYSDSPKWLPAIFLTGPQHDRRTFFAAEGGKPPPWHLTRKRSTALLQECDERVCPQYDDSEEEAKEVIRR